VAWSFVVNHFPAVSLEAPPPASVSEPCHDTGEVVGLRVVAKVPTGFLQTKVVGRPLLWL
jgi:hypothetical protein